MNQSIRQKIFLFLSILLMFSLASPISTDASFIKKKKELKVCILDDFDSDHGFIVAEVVQRIYPGEVYPFDYKEYDPRDLKSNPKVKTLLSCERLRKR